MLHREGFQVKNADELVDTRAHEVSRDELEEPEIVADRLVDGGEFVRMPVGADRIKNRISAFRETAEF